MNKVAVVLTVAAVATLSGCKDPDYTGRRAAANAGETAVSVPVETAKPAEINAEAAPVEAPKPVPAPVVAAEPNRAEVVAPVAAPVEADYTIYTVKPGDYLAKISKKFNVRIDAVRKANPSMKKDIVRVGQKIKIPGSHAIAAEEAAPVVKNAAPVATKAPAAKKGYKSYTGATKEYVVKSGDNLGSIAYGNGINVRQLKELNGLKNNNLRVGQKLKIPAEKVVAAKTDAKGANVAKKPATMAVTLSTGNKPEAAPAPAPAEVKTEAAPKVEAAPAPAAPAPAEAQAKSVETTDYVVQEGDDLTGVAFSWGVSVAKIRELNNLGEKDQLKPGQKIKIPKVEGQQE